MTNEETLELLKPIMLDGSEKVGDKVYCLPFGEVEITDIKEDDEYPIFINVFGLQFSIHGYNVFIHKIPTLFKCNPFEWLNDQLFIEQRQNEMLVAELKERDNNQERVIEVLQGNKWLKRVLVKTTKANHALCWSVAETIEDAINEREVHIWHVWRELPIQKTITKEQALQMLAENGVDTTNLIIE